MGPVISGAVWHVTWQHFRGDLWLLLQLTYTSPFPAPTLHLKLVCKMEWQMEFISGAECPEKNRRSVEQFRLWQGATARCKILPQYWENRMINYTSNSYLRWKRRRQKLLSCYHQPRVTARADKEHMKSFPASIISYWTKMMWADDRLWG